MMRSRLGSVLAVFAALSLVACATPEQRAIEQYFTEAQEIAEDLVKSASSFEALMNAQADPLVWSEDTQEELQDILEDFLGLKAQAEEMSVPPELTDVHPLLVQSLGDMAAAVKIIRDIAEDPSTASEAKADEMTAKAENAERLAGEYVQKLQETLEREYPELMQE